MKHSSKISKSIIGWRETVSLPELGLENIVAKVDTGARTSTLHAFSIEFTDGSENKIKFFMHPAHRDDSKVVRCQAIVTDRRKVRDSGGNIEERYIITTPLQMGDRTWPIEVTLTNRDTMLFRMLVGRTALRHHYLVNPSRSFLLTQRPNKRTL